VITRKKEKEMNSENFSACCLMLFLYALMSLRAELNALDAVWNLVFEEEEEEEE
jgi:hypothetical protein